MIIIELFKVFGNIVLENKDVNKKLTDSTKNAEGFASKLGGLAQKAAVVGTGIAVGVGGAATALIGLANNAAGTTDRIDKMSQKLGMSKKGFQEWDYILSQNGTSIDSMGAGMKTLTNQFDELGKGGKVATDAFGALGLTYTDLQGLSQEEIFEKTIIALQGVEDTTKRAAIANDLLGKSGAELAPVFNSGADSVQNLKKQAQDMNLVLSDDAVNAGVKWTDTVDNLKRSFGSVVAKIGTSAMPIVQKFADLVLDNMPLIQTVFSKVVGVVSNLVDAVLPILLDLFSYWAENILPPLINLLSEIITAILPVLKQLFEVFTKSILPVFNRLFDVIVKDILPLLIDLFNEIVEEIMPVLLELFEVYVEEILPLLIDLFVDVIKDILPIVIDLIKQLIPTVKMLITTFVELLRQVLPPLTKTIQFLADIIFSELKRNLEALKPVLDNVKGYFENIIGFIKNVFTGNWKGVWQNVVGIFKNVFEGIVGIAKIPINNMIKLLNTFISGVNKIEIPDWIPGLGGKGINIPKIPMLAVGTNYVPHDTLAMIHEGEAVIPKKFNPYADGNGGLGVTNNFNIAELVVREDADIHKIARELFNLQQKASFAGAY